MSNKTYVVYLHCKKGTKDVFYVGIGSKRRAFSTEKRNSIWFNYFNKYGRDVYVINKDLSYEDALYIEKELIHTFGRIKFEEGGTLTNRVISLGCHFQGKNHSKETKKKMSNSALKRVDNTKKVFWKGVIYKSLRECSRITNTPFSTVQKYVNWNIKKDCYII